MAGKRHWLKLIRQLTNQLNTQRKLNQRFTFGNGENLIITTNGLQGDSMRMLAASYLTTREARQKIYEEVQPRELDETRMKAHGRQRALFVFNMHRPSSNLLDKVFGKEKPIYAKKNKPTNRRNSNARRAATV